MGAVVSCVSLRSIHSTSYPPLPFIQKNIYRDEITPRVAWGDTHLSFLLDIHRHVSLQRYGKYVNTTSCIIDSRSLPIYRRLLNGYCQRHRLNPTSHHCGHRFRVWHHHLMPHLRPRRRETQSNSSFDEKEPHLAPVLDHTSDFASSYEYGIPPTTGGRWRWQFGEETKVRFV